ncbi:MAG: MFS transporter [Oscillospiraceae bacterium]|jgi:DHA1 family multidrug resistance protein-like MFS transporter|nr:MFS transporter [Oscillospiraceae bacterium]
MNWKRTLWVLWAANFVITSGMNLVIPFLSFYIESLGVTDIADVERWSGWVFSAQFVTSVVFQPIWGKFADKHGRKPMLLRAGVGMGVVTLLMGLAGSVWQLLLLRLINGVFSGFVSMAISLQASVTPDKNAGEALGTLQTGAVAGGLIGPLFGGYLAELIDYSHIFFLTAALHFAACAIVVLLVHEPREHAPKAGEGKADMRLLMPLLPVFIASAITQVGMMSIEPIVSLYTETLYGGENLELMAGLAVAATGMANLVGAPVLGRIADRAGQRKVLCFSLVAASLMFLPQAFAANIGMLFAGRFLLGLFIGGMLPSLNALVRHLAPKSIQATAFGFNSSAIFLGNLTGPLIGSAVAAAYGFRDVFFVTMAFLLANALMIIPNRRLDVPPHTGGETDS